MRGSRDPRGGPGDGATAGSRTSSIILIAVVALATWPITRLAPPISIDGSWMAGLHGAAHHGIAHGTGIDFTYGPFGYLSAPRLLYPETAIAAVLYTLAVHIAFIAVIFLGTRRRCGVFLATAIALAIGSLALMEAAEMALLVYFAACMACLRAPTERRVRGLVLAGTLIGAFQLLVKFNTGLIVLALAAALILALPKRRPSSLLLHGAGFAAGTFALWMIAGQPLGAFGAWLRNSAEIAVGYTSAMANELRPAWEYWIVAATVVAIIVLAYGTRSRTAGRSRLAVYAVLALLLFAQWKHSFVRHDVHSFGFYVAAVVVALSLMWLSASATRPLIVAVLLMIAAGVAIPGGSRGDLFRPIAFFRQTRTIASESRRDALMTAARRRIVRLVPIDGKTLSMLAGRTVHVDPNQVLLAWAYGFDWRPAPIFQTYSAYTTRLDRFNASFLAGPDAPDRILRVRSKAIDSRNPLWESPDYVLSLLCHYRETSAIRNDEVVERTGDRCGPERHIVASAGSAGFVNVPNASPDDIVVMRIRTTISLYEWMRAVAWKPTSPPHVELRDAGGVRRFRLVEATEGDSLVLCVPAAAGFDDRFVDTVCPDAVRVTDREDWSVEFSTVPIR